MIITQTKDLKIWFNKSEIPTAYDSVTGQMINTDGPPTLSTIDCYSFNLTKEMLPENFFIETYPSYDPEKPGNMYNIDIGTHRLEFTSKSVSKLYYKTFLKLAEKDVEYIEDIYEELKI